MNLKEDSLKYSISKFSDNDEPDNKFDLDSCNRDSLNQTFKKKNAKTTGMKKNLKLILNSSSIHLNPFNLNSFKFKRSCNNSKDFKQNFFNEAELIQNISTNKLNKIFNNNNEFPKNNCFAEDNERIFESEHCDTPLNNNFFNEKIEHNSNYNCNQDASSLLSYNISKKEIIKPKRSYFDFFNRNSHNIINETNKHEKKNIFHFQINFKDFNHKNKNLLKKVIFKINKSCKSSNIKIKRASVLNQCFSINHIQRNRIMSINEELNNYNENHFLNKKFSFKTHFSGIKFNTFLKFNNKENKNYLKIINKQIDVFKNKFENQSNFIQIFKSIILNYPIKQSEYLNLNFFEQLKLVTYLSTRFLNLNSVLKIFGNFWPNIQIIQFFKTYSKK